ncbi:hypothetical protein Drorol1_Dr00013201 [Drosera rotundifolia]
MTSPTAVPSKSIDVGLWFPSFSLLYKDLENLPVACPPPSSLTERIRESRDWFLDTVNGFKGNLLLWRWREAMEAAGLVVRRREVVVEEKRRELVLKLSDLVVCVKICCFDWFVALFVPLSCSRRRGVIWLIAPTCREMGDDRKVFNEMSIRDAFTWSTLISGFAKLGDMGSAKEL